MGIDLQQITLDLTGDGDLHGFMNLGKMRPGLSKVSVKAAVKANATRTQIQELHDFVNAHSPIWDTLANPVKIDSVLIEARPS